MNKFRYAACAAILPLCIAAAFADDNKRQPNNIDPGVRGGKAAAGGPVDGLSPGDLNFFNAARTRFQEVNSVSGKMPNENGIGLGPRFNSNSCASCHAQPDVGGSSPGTNPQIAVATLDGAQNKIPSFIKLHGPVREVRFIKNPDGTPDGGVHGLFVITGRSDAPGCKISQPDFEDALERHNIIFRIPTPIFGAGLVENTPDNYLIADVQALANQRQAKGISGHFNHSGNDGTITRFGWKAQNKSLLVFSAEAYNVEQGTTNEGFPDKRENDKDCLYNDTPEDSTAIIDSGDSNSPASDFSSDIVNFATFARLSAAPTPATPTDSTKRGEQVFTQVGCALCHITQHSTRASPYGKQSNVTYAPFSDFQVHAMGDNLADQVDQGEAAGNEFRTAPLWGVGQRIFFLHDGRSSDLLDAIAQHTSNGSEANAVINQFNALPSDAKQDLLNFLRSL